VSETRSNATVMLISRYTKHRTIFVLTVIIIFRAHKRSHLIRFHRRLSRNQSEIVYRTHFILHGVRKRCHSTSEKQIYYERESPDWRSHWPLST